MEAQHRIPTPDLWTTSQAAAHCGVEPGTFRYYVHRYPGLTPVVNVRSDDGQRLFVPDEVKAWHNSRPRRGARGNTSRDEESRP